CSNTDYYMLYRGSSKQLSISPGPKVQQILPVFQQDPFFCTSKSYGTANTIQKIYDSYLKGVSPKACFDKPNRKIDDLNVNMRQIIERPKSPRCNLMHLLGTISYPYLHFTILDFILKYQSVLKINTTYFKYRNSTYAKYILHIDHRLKRVFKSYKSIFPLLFKNYKEKQENIQKDYHGLSSTLTPAEDMKRMKTFYDRYQPLFDRSTTMREDTLNTVYYNGYRYLERDHKLLRYNCDCFDCKPWLKPYFSRSDDLLDHQMSHHQVLGHSAKRRISN
ncbi:Hypothetical predicted protein, partial [Mytilus galloprovincialis]